MKVHLLYADRVLEPCPEPPADHADLVQDLGLGVLSGAMAGGDAVIADVVDTVVMNRLDDPRQIAYRQHVLADCLAQPAVVRKLYDLAVESLTREKRVWGFGLDRHPAGLLHRSTEALELLVGVLRRLRRVADEHAAAFRSEGFTTFFETLAKELDDDYFATVSEHLRRLRFRDGVQLSAELGAGNRGGNYVLRRPNDGQPGWLSRLLGGDRRGLTFAIADRDEAGARALAELREQGVNLVANALAQSTDHIVGFFAALRVELGFYVGCLNLAEGLDARGAPRCFPEPLPAGRLAFACQGLYDACLALGRDEPVVGNDVAANGRSLVMITGANQGGKSTFLRSVGLAHLMTQCGMFAPARALRLSVARGLHTHFERAEDATMTSGKLDEELARMSRIAERLAAGAVVLFNESFAATNEREGSQIARQILRALTGAGVRVFYVTHLFDLADGLWRRRDDTTLFLRAERQPDGRRTFRLTPGRPLSTSFGEDVYRRVFGPDGR
jgi:hypothetical protein